MARQRRAGESCTHRTIDARSEVSSISSCSSARATTTPITARARTRSARCWSQPLNATRRWALRMFGPIFRGVRAIMYNSHEERALIQAVAVQRARAGRRRRRRARIFRKPSMPARARQKFGLARTVRDLRRPDRRQQGMRRAVRFLHPVRERADDAARRLVLIGNAGARHPDASAHQAPRIRRRPGQVRRDRRCGRADHAVGTMRACRWWRSRRGRSGRR